MRLEQEQKECFFKPKLNVSSRHDEVYHRPEGDTFYRNKVWQESIQSRLKKQREDEIKRQEKDCTFQPNLNLTATHLPVTQRRIQVQSKGVNKFLQRQ